MAGYLFQARYALLLGIDEARRNPGLELAIETFDDVSFEDSAGPVQLIQTKHHARRAAVSDYSVDLWKTLNVWIHRFLEDPTNATRTRLIFLTTDIVADGSALSYLRKGDDSRTESLALELLVSAAETSGNHATLDARNDFLDLTPTTQQILLAGIWVLDNAPNLIDVRDEIETALHYAAPREQVPDLTDQLEGWWFARVASAITDTQPTAIPLTSIHNKIAELRENYKLRNLPLHESIEDMSFLTEMPSDDRTFIRQMALVQLGDVEVRATVHDYYRAFEQRSRWAREHLLLDGEADRYDRDLQDAWHRRFLRCTTSLDDDAAEHTKVVQGKAVFHWAREHQQLFRNRDEIWLSSGSLQMLADDLRVGWHPDYLELLASATEEV